jgi:HEAT repeat protein
MLAALLGAAVVAACGESARRAVAPEQGLRDPVIQTRLEAIAQVGRTRDQRHVPELIGMLDDEDPGVRMMAGATLRDLTGHDTGYRAHAPPEERRRQIEAWRAWWGGRAGAPR